MPPITRIIRARSSDAPAEIIRTLHAELAAVGLPVSGTEASGTPRFEAATESRVRDFQTLYRLPDTGSLDPVTGGIMTVAALVASEPDRNVLRQKLREAAAAGPDAPEFKNWMARSAILAGDYPLAAQMNSHLVDLSAVGTRFDELLTLDDGPGSPRQPEVPFPENFYSYRQDVMAQQVIDELRTKRYIPDPVDHPTDALRKKKLADSAEAWLSAIEAWQQGNADSERQRYDGAVAAYDRCQQAALDYFANFPGYAFTYANGSLPERMDELLRRLVSNAQSWADIASQITWRRQLLSLAELREFDGRVIVPGDAVHQMLLTSLTGTDQFPHGPTVFLLDRKWFMDARLVVIAAVLVPLARAEANRLRRQYAAARSDLTRFLRRSIPLPNTPLRLSVWLACEFIEIPFARLLLVETMLDQAEAQYKARRGVDDESDATVKAAQLAQLGQLAQDFSTRQILGDAVGNATRPFQYLVAALTYADAIEVMRADGDYVARAKLALDTLHTAVVTTVTNGDVTSRAFRSVAHGVTIPTLIASGADLPGLTSGTHPHEPYLQFEHSQPMRERNPRVYALLLQAQSRLLQIWSGFNYLGYRDDYVPPWRFSYLLDRARYFSEHAKNAQRDYINFLSNAENEEFKEMSTAQNVEMEKSNIRIETARVDQVGLEVAAAQQSVGLAEQTALDAKRRLDRYKEFDQYADTLFHTNGPKSLEGLAGIIDGIPGLGEYLGGVGDFYTGGAISNRKQVFLADEQRGVEQFNLGLAWVEAFRAADVARAQLAAAQAGLVVAGLQRQAALLRHEFALQNLQFMRNRTLNSEQWYRLAGAIRSVSDTYLRYAIEMAFLAEQVYEFEADKRIDIIRFDYDASEVGAMLAGDFLLRDIDTLEQDLIVGQKLRQQHVRYVLSLAREYPEALQELRDNGHMTFSLRLEQLERRFPGLFNLRISSVEVLPFALMDAARFSLELTHLGSGQVRMKAQPGSSLETNTTDWLSGLQTEWTVKPRMMGPETTIFSGLSRQDLGGNASFFASNQRGAFEGLPGAGSWQIDLSMKENRIVPDTLADLLLTFTLSGYYDAGLRRAVDHAPRTPMASTAWLSAHRSFPDAHYQFNRTGRMEWNVTPDVLALQGSLDRLQNVAVVCVPSQRRPELGRMMCSYPVEFVVDSTGATTILRNLPNGLSFTANSLTLNATIPTGASVSFDFGDGSGLTESSTLPPPPHTYARPGRYEVLIRIAVNGRLTEYRAAVAVSRQHAVDPPCIATPSLGVNIANGKVELTPSLQIPPGESLAVTWSIDGITPDPSSNPVKFIVDIPEFSKPRRYVLRFSSVRPLRARFYSQQRHDPDTLLSLNRLHLATNRTFDPEGNETTNLPNLNEFGRHVFGLALSATLSPTDRWTLELPLDGNPCVVSVSSTDVKQHDLSELADAFLALEYKVRDE